MSHMGHVWTERGSEGCNFEVFDAEEIQIPRPVDKI